MSGRNSGIDEKWVNAVLFDLLKVVYDGFGGASKFRCCIVGRSLLKDLAKKLSIDFSNLAIPEAIKKVLEALKAIGVIGGGDVALSDMVLDFKIRDCVHLPVQKKVRELKMPSFVCLCANLCLGLIEERYGLDTELIEINQEGSTCHIRAMLFKWD